MSRARRPITTFSSHPGLVRFIIPTIAVMLFGGSIVKLIFRAGMEKWHEAVGPRVTISSVANIDWHGTPPKPDKYVTDLAGVLDPDRAAKLNETLAQFERETSNQVIVYVARSVPYDTTMEEVATASFAQWGIGQKGKSNGVLFLVFVDDRTMRIEVGYGLEGALTDAKSKRITSTVVKPFFKEGDYTGGIEAGSRAIMAVIRGEASGDGKTFAEAASLFGTNIKQFGLEALGFVLVSCGIVLLAFPFGVILAKLEQKYRTGGSFAGGGSTGSWSSSSSSSSYSSSSSFSSSSSSSFSGGGGSSGGGGASDSW